MEEAEQTVLNEALKALWVKFLPQLEERLAVLDTANDALAESKLSEDLRAEANSAAHKLAGVLGTFGLTRGTVLAREAELIYEGDIGTDRHAVEHLTGIAHQLRTLIESHK
jgi:HPt (histidine-containing phosphotransfer) domain-containing protein